MKTITNKYNNELMRYISRTINNKILALVLIACGIVSVYVENDSTFLMFTLIGGIPLFLTRKKIIY